MKKVLIFSGTTEGRKLATLLAEAGIYSDVAVATSYGSQVMEKSEYINVCEGRIDVNRMSKLYDNNDYIAVVDATHPYATEVTANIKESLKERSIPYFRLLRKEDETDTSGLHFFDSAKKCAEALVSTKGRILLTTGSKELGVFCKDEALRERIVARVLPVGESLNACYEAGLLGKQIIAMQGPFSVSMNEAQIREYDVSILVTKESGHTGGTDTKLIAAKNTNTECYIIRRPETNETYGGLSFEDVLQGILKLTGCSITRRRTINVSLIGMGMDGDKSLTYEAAAAIKNAEYIFGAKRLIQNMEGRQNIYPYYLAKDIRPVLEEALRSSDHDLEAVILFSGDTGFFSGAKAVYDELKENESYRVNIIPGISSLAAISARAGISWQDVAIISAHGRQDSKWEAVLLDAVRFRKKCFVLTSGVATIHRIGEILKEFKHSRIFVGYNLGYPEEKITEIGVDECNKVEGEGLFSLIILNGDNDKKIITPHIADEDFIREDVPMTKEAVRHLSVCRLKLWEDSVVYDIGSGTGSVTVEIAAMSPGISVYAIESEEKAYELTCKNIEAAGLLNVTAINGMAPEAFKNLPVATHAFIGGSRGNMRGILEALKAANPKMRVVINAVSMETICEINELLREITVSDLAITQLSVSNTRSVGGFNMLSANNPVFVFSFNFE